MGVDMSKSHPDMATDEHMRTYKGFLVGTAISIVLIAALLLGMAYFLV